MKALSRVAGAGVLALAVGAFVLSFAKLYVVAETAGYGRLSVIYPAIVEGFTTLCTLAAFLRHGQRGAWYPWAVGLGAFAYSLWANSLPASVPPEVIRAVPVVCIPLSVHMWIIVAGLADRAAAIAEQEAVEAAEAAATARETGGTRKRTSAATVDPQQFLQLASEAQTPERKRFWERKHAQAVAAQAAA